MSSRLRNKTRARAAKGPCDEISKNLSHQPALSVLPCHDRDLFTESIVKSETEKAENSGDEKDAIQLQHSQILKKNSALAPPTARKRERAALQSGSS